MNKTKKLRQCLCGGDVELIPLGYPHDTYNIVCSKCGGIWHKNFYSAYEAMKDWGFEDENNSLKMICFTVKEKVNKNISKKIYEHRSASFILENSKFNI